MNTDDPRFDRLVDDELSEQQRQELLAGLDSEPGGWRRCALAFLESQCWKQTLGGIARQGTLQPGPQSATLPRHSPWPRRLGIVLAMAASFLVAFWGGTSLQRLRLGHPTTPAGTTDQLATTAHERSVPAGWNQARNQLAGIAPSPKTSSGPWRLVTVSAPAGAAGQRASIDLPAIERDGVDQQWLQSLPSAIPDDVRQAFNRTGHQIEQHRELIPVPLEDGRRLVVPVDQVDVHYVGNGTY